MDAFTHSTGQCQLFDVQHDELWVYMSLSDKELMKAVNKCWEFELTADIYSRLNWVPGISFQHMTGGICVD